MAGEGADLPVCPEKGQDWLGSWMLLPKHMKLWARKLKQRKGKDSQPFFFALGIHLNNHAVATCGFPKDSIFKWKNRLQAQP